MHILLVEDSQGDVYFVTEALRRTNSPFTLHVVSEGSDAMQYLRREGEFVSAAEPDLIILDLNLPAMDGREVLREIQEDARLRQIPLVIFTSSPVESGMVREFCLPPERYILKPLDFGDYVKAVGRALEFARPNAASRPA